MNESKFVISPKGARFPVFVLERIASFLRGDGPELRPRRYLLAVIR